MNQNKKFIISLGVIFSVMLLSFSILKISINILYPVNELSNSLKDTFKDIFGKAIKFDSLHFKYNGDIVLQNFYLSNTNDFNDNINLIKCREITIDTYLLDLIRKKVTFSGVYMSEPEITIIKNYGKTYNETFIEELINGINENKIKQFITEGFRFELTDSSLAFRETLKNSKSELDLYNLDLMIKYKSDYITYRSYGTIQDRINNSWFKKSRYRVKGKIFLNKDHSESDIELENFDLSHLNNLLNDRLTTRTLMAGTFSGELKLINENDVIKCKGSTDTSSLNILYYENDTPFPFIKDEDFETEFSFNISRNCERLTVDKLVIDDDIVELSTSVDFLKNDFISFQIKSNIINLDELSEKFFIFKNCRYGGKLSVNGICKYKLNENKPENINLDMILDKFSLVSLKQSPDEFKNIKDANILLSANNDKIAITTNLKTGNSDFNVSLNSAISCWNPIKTTNTIEIVSKKIELDLLRELFTDTIKKVYSLAYVDMFQNFDEQRNFLKEPEGIFINNNDISLKLFSEKLIISGKSYLDNLNIDISLLKGTLKTNSFSLSGYNGTYSFDLFSSLKQEYPFFKFNFKVDKLDLSQISNNAGLDYSLGGILSLNLSFETSAYRIGQVIENGKAVFDVSIKDGYINNMPIQRKLNEFMSQNNYKNIFNKRMDFTNFSVGFMQSANTFFIRNLNFNSNIINFTAYGNFTEEEGLKVPLNLNIIKDNNIERVPLEITGSFEAPCINLKIKNKSESVCF